MKNKEKFLYTDSQTKCMLQTKKGIFSGVANFKEGDVPSSFMGSTIARLKAERAVYKNELKLVKNELKTTKRLLKDIETHCKYPDFNIKKRFYIEIKECNKKIQLYQSFLTDIDNEIIYYLKTKEKIHNRIKKDNNN